MQTVKGDDCTEVHSCCLLSQSVVFPRVWKSGENEGSHSFVVSSNNYGSLCYNGICGTVDCDTALILT